ncbi:MAG: transglycosylase SLT domain-containing protein [Gammaproteobacteria bacterium]|nr:transglycosylase SLT domain-containing protein [Gammaproteobacteria bacterium]
MLLVSLALCRPALAGPTGEPSPALRAALAVAMKAPADFDDRYAAEVWFVDMAGRLAPFMPDAEKRLHFLKVLHQEATRAGVEPELVLAVIQVESGFDRYAISASGAQGYMQIMPFWLEEIGDPAGNLFDLHTNLRMGCTILRYYIDASHGDWVKALARYNGSTGRADYPYLVLKLLNRRWSPN